MTRILIVDDHDLILEGLTSKLKLITEDIVRARSYKAAVDELNGHPFDFCIIDHGLEPGSGEALLKEIRSVMPATKAICISGEFSVAKLAQLTHSGFNGYYAKSDELDEIIAAVESLTTDEVFYSSSLQPKMRDVEDLPKLSPRQHELLVHLAAGKSNSEAAEAMGVRPATISFHMKHLKRKLGAKERARYRQDCDRPRLNLVVNP